MMLCVDLLPTKLDTNYMHSPPAMCKALAHSHLVNIKDNSYLSKINKGK